MRNSLKYAKLLEDTGLSRQQAETHVQIISDSLGDEMATKTELNSLEHKIDQVETRLMSRIKDVEHKLQKRMEFIEHKLQRQIEDLKHEMQKLEHRITLRLGALMVVVPTVIKVLFN